jgi:hypothetical protein
MTVGDAGPQQERRILRLDLARHRQLARAVDEAGIVELGERVQVPQLLLRGVGAPEAVEHHLEVVRITGRRHDHRRRGDQLRIDRPAGPGR